MSPFSLPDKSITLLMGSDGTPVAYVLPRVTDYFELEHLTQLARFITDSADPQAVATRFAAGVFAHTEKLTHLQVIAAGVSMLEDLYAAMGSSQRGEIPLPTGLDLYLRATAGALTHEIGNRGYRLQYVIDNQFPTGALGPAAVYPLWFRAAGFVYISPFEAALSLMERDGIEPRAFDEFWTRYEAEGRAMACDLYERADSDGQHVVVIDDEPEEALLVRAMSNLPRPALINLFRNEPPSVKRVLLRAPKSLQSDLSRLRGD